MTTMANPISTVLSYVLELSWCSLVSSVHHNVQHPYDYISAKICNILRIIVLLPCDQD